MARNTYFQFKQFRIQQDRCAMKVCTDACVLGAWADGTGAQRALDIGAGTGLLSLMLAQRYPHLRIDAVELDEAAARQATENAASSPFSDRITVRQAAIQQVVAEPYDLILTNPPFYQADLRSPDAAINRAHHAQSLSLPELVEAVDRLLKKTGRWFVLLPVEESRLLEKLAQASGWVRQQQVLLAHQPGRKPFRMLTAYGPSDMAVVTNQPGELFIYESDGTTYTPVFRALLHDFYLLF